MLSPPAQSVINKESELQIELRQNPCQLTDIIDWNRQGNA